MAIAPPTAHDKVALEGLARVTKSETAIAASRAAPSGALSAKRAPSRSPTPSARPGKDTDSAGLRQTTNNASKSAAAAPPPTVPSSCPVEPSVAISAAMAARAALRRGADWLVSRISEVTRKSRNHRLPEPPRQKTPRGSARLPKGKRCEACTRIGQTNPCRPAPIPESPRRMGRSSRHADELPA